MFFCRGKYRCGKTAVILGALFLSLVAIGLAPRINYPFAPSLPVNDIGLAAPAEALPTVALQRSAKTFPNEFRAITLSATVVQPIPHLSTAIVPDRHASILQSSRLLGSLVIRAPPLV